MNPVDVHQEYRDAAKRRTLLSTDLDSDANHVLQPVLRMRLVWLYESNWPKLQLPHLVRLRLHRTEDLRSGDQHRLDPAEPALAAVLALADAAEVAAAALRPDAATVARLLSAWSCQVDPIT